MLLQRIISDFYITWNPKCLQTGDCVLLLFTLKIEGDFLPNRTLKIFFNKVVLRGVLYLPSDIKNDTKILNTSFSSFFKKWTHGIKKSFICASPPMSSSFQERKGKNPSSKQQEGPEVHLSEANISPNTKGKCGGQSPPDGRGIL